MRSTEVENKLSGDILYQSRLRSRLLAAIVIVLVIAIIFNGVVYNDEILHLYSNRLYLYLSIALLVMLGLRGFFISFAMKHVYKRFGKLPLTFRYFNIKGLDRPVEIFQLR